MHRPGRAALTAITTLAAAAALAAPATAEPTQIGGWFGPRIFSSDSKLGYIESSPEHPSLANTVALGLRVGKPLFTYIVPELEVAFAPTETTKTIGAKIADVYWLNPRLHLRFEVLPGRRLQPFFVAGGGVPISLSTARMTLDSGATGSGYVGAGVRFDSQKGFVLRFDARIAFLPGIERFVAAEADFGFGIEIALGKRGRRTGGETQIAKNGTEDDRDGDGVPDAKDGCPDRPEDADGFQDDDGCPDIDNDLDRVLDIADKCANVPETYNGFQDDDGCPDTLPPEVDALKGTVEGLLYAEGETMVRDSAQPNIQKIAKTMTTHPSIRVVLIGHTDDREAKQFATSDDPAAPPPDLAALSADLSRARAEAVKQALTALGIAGPRIDVEGHGAEEPVSDNDKPRGRLANRRVEIKLYVPPSSGLAK
jgi:outer membrane protein OmpA-like peptidoglycan-associated protein